MTIWKKDECILLPDASEKSCRRSRRIFVARLELEDVLMGLSYRISDDMRRKETSTDIRTLIDNAP